MTEIHRSAQVPYGADKMYALVTDVASYPQFLPWCDNVVVLQESDAEVKARVSLALGKLHQHFTTRNRLQPHDSVVMELVEGPFKHLTGVWRFQPVDGGCHISLDMRFEFKNTLTRLAMGGPFNKIANTLMDAFIQRAHDLYG